MGGCHSFHNKTLLTQARNTCINLDVMSSEDKLVFRYIANASDILPDEGEFTVNGYLSTTFDSILTLVNDYIYISDQGILIR